MTKAKDWAELERLIGIRPTVRRGVTQRDVAELTRRRLKGPFWRPKKR